MDTTTAHQMTVKKYPRVWRLSCDNWCMDIVRSAATDAYFQADHPTVLAVTTREVTVSIESRLGTHTTTRTEIVRQEIITQGRGTMVVTADMV